MEAHCSAGAAEVTAQVVTEFNHHSPDLIDRWVETYRNLRAKAPVTWTEAHGGYWVVTSYREVSAIAHDDFTFSSRHDAGLSSEMDGDDQGFEGVLLPPDFPISSGIIETDPPRFGQIRKQLNPLFSPRQAELLEPEIREYTTWCIDQFIESGRCDLVLDLCTPVPTLLTLRILGIDFEHWKVYADAIHRGVYIPPDHPDREEVERIGAWVIGQFFELAEARREEPTDDLISFLATMEVEGEPMPIDEVVGNAFVVLGGGVDTTTALLANTFLHLAEDRAARERLRSDPTALPAACEEYLRYYTPIQGLARTVTAPCVVGGQAMQPRDRVYLSWAAANLDPDEFECAETIRLDRTPNRHSSFGLGAHRCLGASLARLMWRTIVSEVLQRMPDYEASPATSERYPSIGTTNGWATVPATFTPGPRLGTGLSL